MLNLSWHVVTIVVVGLLLTFSNSETIESLEEAINVGTGDTFNKIFAGDGGNAKQMLELYYEKTKIERDYLNQVFVEAAEVSNIEELQNIHLNVGEAVDFINKVIKHFQKNPSAGRQKDEL
ncbi:unnamed protein product [Clavelina lepadiformis]|uniref:Secreted protein n=1 Tax=Clavelina lepadiformis TaxID=159417 RepID=A0ABP0FTR1_CLALP